jgi:dolichol-phosphate mannosyltransferase
MTISPKISLLILARDEWQNLSTLLVEAAIELQQLVDSYEIVVIDGGAPCQTSLPQVPLRILAQVARGYGNAFRQGIQACRGDVILTIDADYSHPPSVLGSLYREAKDADLVIASRYIPGGRSSMSLYRMILSRTLCFTYRAILALSVRDLSSGYRAYQRASLQNLSLGGQHFDVLLEVLVRLTAQGAAIKEIPFCYQPRRFGSSHARVFAFGVSYLKTLLRCCWIRFRG